MSTSQEDKEKPAVPSDLGEGDILLENQKLTDSQLSDSRALYWMRWILFVVSILGASYMWHENHKVMAEEWFHMLLLHQPWSVVLGIAMCVSPLVLFIILMFFVYRRRTDNLSSFLSKNPVSSIIAACGDLISKAKN